MGYADRSRKHRVARTSGHLHPKEIQSRGSFEGCDVKVRKLPHRSCDICHLDCRVAENNIRRRELGVMFENLRVVGLGATMTYQRTFGSMLDPRSILEGIHNMRHPAVRNILSGFEGVVQPGEMLRKDLWSLPLCDVHSHQLVSFFHG